LLIITLEKKEKKEKLYGRETGQTLPQARSSRLTSAVICHLDSRYPSQDVIRMMLYLWSSSPKHILPDSGHEKNIRQISIQVHPTKYLTTIPQNYQGHYKYWQSQPREA